MGVLGRQRDNTRSKKAFDQERDGQADRKSLVMGAVCHSNYQAHWQSNRRRNKISRNKQDGDNQLMKEWLGQNYRNLMLVAMALELAFMCWIAIIETLAYLRRH